MKNLPILTIVIGVRNRTGEHLERCIYSLQAQTYKYFSVILVDYGSGHQPALSIRQTAEKFSFCKYIYTETRGHPWNRSRALNIGGRIADTPYLMTTDVDMVFPNNFLQIVMDNVGEKKVLYCAPDFLESSFQDWQNLENYAGKFRRGGISSKGGCQIIPTKTFHKIQGFDETYQYWGTEDRDMNIRLLALGFKEYWLNDQTYFFHQWHPTANSTTMNFMPNGQWNAAQIYFLKNINRTIRNRENWGQITVERPTFQFINPDIPALLTHPDISLFDEPPYSNASIIKLGEALLNLPKGHAIAINHAFFPSPPHWSRFFPLLINKILKWSGGKARINWQPNNLHAFLAEFITKNTSWIDDYYLGLPVKNGISVIVKK